MKELIGAEVGGKLHTGRSRNDQVATDMKLWLREAMFELAAHLSVLVENLTGRAEEYVPRTSPSHITRFLRILLLCALLIQADSIASCSFFFPTRRESDVILPGYTHLQRAQPVLWSHWLLSYAWMVQQDCERLKSSLERLNSCPLGSGAIAGG